MARMPVAVVVEAAGFSEHTVHLNHARAHIGNVRISIAEAIIEGSFLTRITPEDLVVAITVERRVNVYEVYRLVRHFLEHLKVVATINDVCFELMFGHDDYTYQSIA